MGVESGELCSRHMDWFARNQPSSGSGSDISRRKTHVSVLSCAFLLLVYLGFTCQENAYLFRTIRWASSSLGILGEHLSPGIKSHPLTDATVVTAYYPLSQGPKHSLKDYRTWMENFLPHVEAPIIIYLPADEELQATVRDLRGNLPLAIQVSFPSSQNHCMKLAVTVLIHTISIVQTDGGPLGSAPRGPIPGSVQNLAA